MIRIWETGRAPASINMKQDEFLLANLEKDPQPVLHLYDWMGSCATFGHFIKPENHFHFDKLEKFQIDLEKRPTGGGVIFHMYDLTFSLVIPTGHPLYFQKPLDSYAAVNLIVVQVICDFLGRPCKPQLLNCQPQPYVEAAKHFCMAHPTKYDVILEKKVGGAAQRRTRFGYLHQGSISLITPSFDLIRELLKNGDQIASEMEKSGQALLPVESTRRDFEEAKQTLRSFLKKRFADQV